MLPGGLLYSRYGYRGALERPQSAHPIACIKRAFNTRKRARKLRFLHGGVDWVSGWTWIRVSELVPDIYDIGYINLMDRARKLKFYIENVVTPWDGHRGSWFVFDLQGVPWIHVNKWVINMSSIAKIFCGIQK